MSSHSNKQRNIIPSLLLDKFILNDNNKIIKLARHLLSIYSRSIRKVKVKWLLMWRYKLHLYLSESYFEMKKKTNVHERLFNDYKHKEALMFNLMKHYDSIESEKYPFMPLINKCSFNFVNNITLPNKIEEKDYLECFKGKCSSDRKMHSKGKVIQYSQPNCVSSVKQNHIHIKSEQLLINNNNNNNSITLKDQNYKRNQSNSKHETFIDISRSYEPKTAKISSYHNNSQSKITINNNNDIVNDYYCSGNTSNTNNNNNNNTNASFNVNMFYKKNGLINGYYNNYNKKKAPKINLNSSSSTISLQSTQNKTKRHNNSTSSNTLLINTTTPTTSITKSKHPNNKHYIGKTLYNTIKDTNAFNTITHNNNSISNITANNNNQQLFTNRLKNKTNLLTERTNAKTVHHDKMQSNGYLQDTTSKKSFINKYRKNTPLVTRSYTAGGIDEKRTSCYSQTNSTTNLEITINHKKDQSSKEIMFSNGNSNVCNGSTFQNKNNQFIITNLKQQHYSGGYNYNYNYNYPYKHSNKMISPSEQIINKQEINNQCLFSIINKESNQYNSNSNNKLKITNREVNENIDNGKNYIDNNNVNNNIYDNNNTARNEVTLQSLSDSKMYEIANHYITTDESLDRYQCLSYTTSKRK